MNAALLLLNALFLHDFLHVSLCSEEREGKAIALIKKYVYDLVSVLEKVICCLFEVCEIKPNVDKKWGQSVLLKLRTEKSYAEAEQPGRKTRICPVEVGYVGDSWEGQRLGEPQSLRMSDKAATVRQWILGRKEDLWHWRTYNAKVCHAFVLCFCTFVVEVSSKSKIDIVRAHLREVDSKVVADKASPVLIRWQQGGILLT